MGFVKEFGGVESTAASTLLASGSTASGDLLVACITWQSTSITITSVTDDGGNTWQVFPSASTNASTGGSAAIWYSQTTHANSTGVTVNLSASVVASVSVQEHTGSWTPDVEHTGGASSGTSWSSGTTGALAGGSDLAIGMVGQAASSTSTQTITSTGSGYTATTQRNSS